MTDRPYCPHGVARFQVLMTGARRYYWVLLTAEGLAAARSTGTFDTEDEARDDAQAICSSVVTAEVAPNAL